MLGIGARSSAEIHHSSTKMATTSIATMTRNVFKTRWLPPPPPIRTLRYVSSVRDSQTCCGLASMAC